MNLSLTTLTHSPRSFRSFLATPLTTPARLPDYSSRSALSFIQPAVDSNPPTRNLLPSRTRMDGLDNGEGKKEGKEGRKGRKEG